MKTMTDQLKDLVDRSGIVVDDDAMFELIATESCSTCCAISNGGNSSGKLEP